MTCKKYTQKRCENCKNAKKCAFLYAFPDIAIHYAEECDDFEPE